MRERDIVRFELAGKLRLGVVIEVQGDRARVAYGTTQDHAAPCELVHMAKLVYPIEGECQPVTRCGCALSMPWQLADDDASCMACIATGTG